MKFKITGKFQVKLTPQEVSFKHNSTLNAGRLNIDKTFEGALSGVSHGEMLSILVGDKKAGGYVAMEVFEGTLEGRAGSFALQHYGKYDSNGQSLVLELVPGSGDGQLVGISGKMHIRIEEKQHFYDFEGEI